jgi:two-component system, OmpR family, response regulator
LRKWPTLARILLIEDDPSLCRGLAATLGAEGYSVDVAYDGEGGLQMALDEPYALILLDVGLPDMSGFELLRRLRRAGDKAPVLMLSARDTVADRVNGLDLGADDYLLKPFAPQELSARIRALMRRPQIDAAPVMRIGRLEFDRTHGSAAIGGQPIELRRREWVLLERLAVRVGQVVSKDRLASEVFGFNEPVAPNAIEVYIARLRRKLEPAGPRIRTLRGLGYLMEAD